MNMDFNENEPEEWLGADLGLYILTPGPEYGRPFYWFRTAIQRVYTYTIRSNAVPIAWKLRCNMQPWLRKLLNPYFIFYN